MTLRFATVTTAKTDNNPMKITPDGFGAEITVSFMVGASPAQGARVLWDTVDASTGYGQVVCFAYTDVR